jgi:ADP-L-glycero-D-manno-heptose 6-epimerase
MIVVTGALGFIGFNLVKRLNKLKKKNLILVDYKKKNLNSKKNIKYKKFIETDKFYKNLEKYIPKSTECIFHQGANSSTTEKNRSKIFKQNYYSTMKLIKYSLKNNIKIIYASSAATYGIKKNNFRENNWKLNPANFYAETKFLADKEINVILKKKPRSNIVGLRYFNVYGPYESHKLNMASVIYNFNDQYKRDKIIKLFKGSHNYKNGEQLRDFIHVNDCVNVNIFFFKNKISGIFNVGTGKCEKFNTVGKQILEYHKKSFKKITYIDFPKSLMNSYQAYTKADITKLRKAGYKQKFITIKQGIKSYLKFLNK